MPRSSDARGHSVSVLEPQYKYMDLVMTADKQSVANMMHAYAVCQSSDRYTCNTCILPYAGLSHQIYGHMNGASMSVTLRTICSTIDGVRSAIVAF